MLSRTTIALMLTSLADGLEEVSKHPKVFNTDAPRTWREQLDTALEGVPNSEELNSLRQSVIAACVAHKLLKDDMAALALKAANECRAYVIGIEGVEQHSSVDEAEHEFWVSRFEAERAFDADEIQRLTASMCDEAGVDVLTRDKMENEYQSLMDEAQGEVEVCGVRYGAGLIVRRCDPAAFRSYVNEFASDESRFIQITG